MNVSALILTHNEASNLPACMAALEGCDDVVVLDSGSDDGTRQLAESWGARVFVRPFDTFAGQRNYALDTIAFKHSWVLHLDADEVVTPALRDEIARRIPSDEFDAFRLPSKMMFMGRWLKYSGSYPVYQVRLGRSDRLRFVQVGHGQREAEAGYRIGTFEAPYLHYSFSKGLVDWFERHNRYSSAEAEKDFERRRQPLDIRGIFALSERVRRRRALKEVLARLPFRGTFRFLELYVIRLGMLDGLPGLRYCQLIAIYEQMIAAKISYERHLAETQSPAKRGQPVSAGDVLPHA